jgi:two-component system CheB/CheR fusion protein
MEGKKDQCAIDEILQEIFDRRGFDIKSYRMSELQRRISDRMDILKIPALSEYSEYLKVNHKEYDILFDTILENKGQFFRDPDYWQFLKEKIIPEILGKNGEIRIWSAGCAGGEEPYSLGITLAEILGNDIRGYNISIYASDVDDTILKFARSGTYTIEQLTGVSEYVRDKYFTQHGMTYTISKDIKRLLIISRHNLLFNPPIPRVDLLLCRNVLMYFDRVLQTKILSKLQYALNEMGYLWIGRGETPDSEFNDFKQVDNKWRIFKKIPLKSKVERNIKYPYINKDDSFDQIIQNMSFGFLMLDESFNILTFNQNIESLWGTLSDHPFGRSFFDLELSHSPVDLKDRIKRAFATGESIIIEKTEHWLNTDKRIYLKIEIISISSAVIILLHDVTKYYEMEDELRFTLKASEIANEKLFSRNNELENSSKQSQVVNEELQSINEELESINEDLKARNEELKALNAELSGLNKYYEMILNNVGFTVIVTDKDMLVKTWKCADPDIWIGDEGEIIGSFLTDLDIGIPFYSIKDQVEEVIKTARSINSSLQYTNPTGVKTSLEISINPLIYKNPEAPLKNKVEGLVLVVNSPAMNALESAR